MNAWTQVFQAPEWTHPLLNSGEYRLNLAANRVVDAREKFVAALVPGGGLQQELARLPLQPVRALEAVHAAPRLAQLAPVLQATQAIATVGALASVATLGVSCVGFAIVLQRLSRIDGKLDEALAKIDVLVASVHQLHLKVEAMQLARLRAAGESLERALAADSASARLDLARRARDLFQESKHLYLELWRHADPWGAAAIPVPTALEMQGRLISAALGELQAEFICGDMGAFRHACDAAAAILRDDVQVNPAIRFRERSDQVVRGGASAVVAFDRDRREVAGQLLLADEATRWTGKRVVGMASDAELPDLLGIAPHEIAQATRHANGVGYYALSRLA